jgi:hypothetical protein
MFNSNSLSFIQSNMFQNALKYKIYTVYLKSKLCESILQQLGI